MKLIIQIPCYNERLHLGITFKDLPRSIPGIDEIEVLVIDDGSTDGTAEVAEQLGVHHIVRLPRHRGLAAAYMAGLDACLRLGADLVVNTDADNQYRGQDIPVLVEPILENRADIVIGNRETDSLEHFSLSKRILQRFGSYIVRRLSATQVIDSTSGFRAMNRKALYSLFVHNDFSYTLETIIQAGRLGLAIENVTVRANPTTRRSRLFNSIPDYLRRNGPVIFRSYSMYWPVRTFGYLALLLFFFGMVLGIRFLYYYFQNPDVSSHIQSLQVGVGVIVMAFIVALMAFVGDLIATNRRLSEEILTRVRRLDGELLRLKGDRPSACSEGIHSTGSEPWKPGKARERAQQHRR